MTGILGGFFPAFYVKIARQPVGRSIGFLLSFILVISAVFSLQGALLMRPQLELVQKWAEVNLKKISAGFPVIEIKAGELVAPKETYILEMGKDTVFAVEPKQEKEAIILEKYKNVVMLTGKKLVYKKSGDSRSEETRYSLDKLNSLKVSPLESGLAFSFENTRISVTPETVKKWLKVIGFFIFPVFLFIMFNLYSFTKPAQVLFFSLIGLLVNAVLKAQAPYKQIFNICVYALVPATIFVVFLEILHLRLPGVWFLVNAVYVLYIFLGLQAVKAAVSPVR